MNFLAEEGLSNSNFNVQYPGLGNAFSTASSQILNLSQRENITIFNTCNSRKTERFPFGVLKMKGTLVCCKSADQLI
jgi:hypothetical protein